MEGPPEVASLAEAVISEMSMFSRVQTLINAGHSAFLLLPT